MSNITKRAALAARVVGMENDDAVATISAAHCAWRFIVMDGRRCGIHRDNSDEDNTTLCLFSGLGGRIEDAVVGTRTVYAHLLYEQALPFVEGAP